MQTAPPTLTRTLQRLTHLSRLDCSVLLSGGTLTADEGLRGHYELHVSPGGRHGDGLVLVAVQGLPGRADVSLSAVTSCQVEELGLPVLRSSGANIPPLFRASLERHAMTSLPAWRERCLLLVTLSAKCLSREISRRASVGKANRSRRSRVQTRPVRMPVIPGGWRQAMNDLVEVVDLAGDDLRLNPAFIRLSQVVEAYR